MQYHMKILLAGGIQAKNTILDPECSFRLMGGTGETCFGVTMPLINRCRCFRVERLLMPTCCTGGAAERGARLEGCPLALLAPSQFPDLPCPRCACVVQGEQQKGGRAGSLPSGSAGAPSASRPTMPTLWEEGEEGEEAPDTASSQVWNTVHSSLSGYFLYRHTHNHYFLCRYKLYRHTNSR